MCEGCESKKCKIAGCARARTRESPIFPLLFIVVFFPRFLPRFPSHLRAQKSQFPPQNTPSISSKIIRLHQKFIVTNQKLCSHRAKSLSHQARYYLPQNTKNLGDLLNYLRRFFEILPRFENLLGQESKATSIVNTSDTQQNQPMERTQKSQLLMRKQL